MLRNLFITAIFCTYTLLLGNKACWALTVEIDYFSSVAGLENLFKTEVQLLAEMQNYIYNLQQHIDVLQSELNFIHQEHDDASKDLEGYLNNPINAYRLIKRLYTDWPTFEETVTVDATRTNYLENMKELKQNLSFPTQNDMVGSTLALVRLQETYQLDVSQVASGILNGVKYGSSMSWQDCYLVGEYLYAMQDYNHTIPWLKQSTKMLMSGDFNDAEMTLEFIETIAEYHKTIGDFQSALELMDYILSQDETRQSARETKMYLEEVINEGKQEGLMYQNSKQQNHYHNTNEYKLYEKVCRGEFALRSQQQQQQSLLYCRLYTNNHPYRLLQPYKLEELSLDPYIVFIHDVISDHQIEAIKAIAQPHMERSTVFSKDGSHSEITYYRTSKTAWFKYNYHKYTTQWLQHVNHLTGLNTDNAEDLQIANYGLGGHYEPHFDFFTEDYTDSDMEGNRISTAIFYLADVEEGGGTAFPFLNILVKPRKGAMLFWYNLHASGDGDYRTKHAACPVLKGSKWIANVWLRELDQFNRRPCDLTTNHEVSLMYKDYD
ncbi:prolyl 4-hydroxylase subunit alpha-1-like [Lucilia sericata]|uniref:prolyl 4-hydroxylase subunit alpha-1-like n=1 Tax=Lucilia sericata TaxID=13632 RepID=UPI0018A8058A|nr:prolyl 4-hydroxylase subunit alpha-1-like [Lucilia sericata]